MAGGNVITALWNVGLSLRRISFRDDHVAPPGSDRLVEAPYGTVADVALRLQAT
jgi:hypothetical protein